MSIDRIIRWFEDFIATGPYAWFALVFGLVGIGIFAWVFWGIYKEGEPARLERKEKAKEELRLAEEGRKALEQGEKLSETDPRKIAFTNSKLGKGGLIASKKSVASDKEALTAQIFNPGKKDSYQPVKNLGGPTLQDYLAENGGGTTPAPKAPTTPPVPIPGGTIPPPVIVPKTGVREPAKPSLPPVEPILPPIKPVNRPEAPQVNPDLQKLLDDDDAGADLLDKLRKGGLNN